MRECGSVVNRTCSKFNNALAYKTPKITRVLDMRLGLMNYFYQLVILGYLALAIYVGGAYMVQEHAVGTVIANLTGGDTFSRDQHNQVRFWDDGDAQYPPTEIGGIFITTRTLRTNLQTIKQCANPMHPCSEENSADSGGKGAGGEEAEEDTTTRRRLLSEGRLGPEAAEPGAGIVEGAGAGVVEGAYDETEGAPEPKTASISSGAGWVLPAKAGKLKAGRVLLARDVEEEREFEEAGTNPAGSEVDPTAGAKTDPKCSGEGMPEAPYGSGQCAADGSGCIEYIWCPPEGTSPLRTKDMVLDDLSSFKLDFKAHISFAHLLEDSAPLEHDVPPMTLTDLLKKVGADPTEVKQTGAIISMMVWWDCNLETVDTAAQCEPLITYKRLDGASDGVEGFSWRRAVYYYTPAGERARDVQRMIGVRIKMSTFAYGRQSHLLKLILELSIGLTLLGFANSLTDWIMLNVFEDAAMYYHYKIEESADFGDLKERLQNLDPERQVMLLEEKRRREKVMKKGKKRK